MADRLEITRTDFYVAALRTLAKAEADPHTRASLIAIPMAIEGTSRAVTAKAGCKF